LQENPRINSSAQKYLEAFGIGGGPPFTIMATPSIMRTKLAIDYSTVGLVR